MTDSLTLSIPYMEMLPTVAQLLTAMDEKKDIRIQAELLALLPDPATVPFRTLLEAAARKFAKIEPIEAKYTALVREEEELLAKQKQLAALASSSTKWGPKKLPSGETSYSVSSKLEKIQQELDQMTPTLLTLREEIAPLLSQLRGLDLFFQDQTELKEWEQQNYSGKLPDCIRETLDEEEKEFLGENYAVLRLHKALVTSHCE